jgi:hypothetical protein
MEEREISPVVYALMPMEDAVETEARVHRNELDPIDRAPGSVRQRTWLARNRNPLNKSGSLRLLARETAGAFAA